MAYEQVLKLFPEIELVFIQKFYTGSVKFEQFYFSMRSSFLIGKKLKLKFSKNP